MKIITHPCPVRSARPSARNGAGRWLAAVLALAGVAQVASASVLDMDPFWTDRGYAGGALAPDGFATSPAVIDDNNLYYEGKQLVRRGNGDVVVAALVKAPSGAQSNGLWNIGLVRYNAAGSRLVWGDASPGHGHYGDQYIVYPNTATATITQIVDIKEIGNYIVVLANKRFGGSPTDFDTQMYVFEDDGFYLAEIAPFDTSSAAQLGGGLATYSSGGEDYLMVIGTDFVSGHGRGVFRRYRFGESGYATETGIVPLNTSGCWNPAWECHARAIVTASNPFAVGAPRVYVAHAFRANAAQDWDMVVSRMNVDGEGSNTWDPNNIAWDTSDGGDHNNTPIAMTARTTGLGLPASPFRDHIYVMQQVSRSCRAGSAVTEFDHDGGTVGTLRFGGSSADPVLCNLVQPGHDYGTDMAMEGTRLGISGFTERNGNYEGTVAIVDTGRVLRDMRDYTWPIGGARERHSALQGIVGNGDGSFSVTGDARWPNDNSVVVGLRGRTQVITGRVKSDRIFGNGLQP